MKLRIKVKLCAQSSFFIEGDVPLQFGVSQSNRNCSLPSNVSLLARIAKRSPLLILFKVPKYMFIDFFLIGELMTASTKFIGF